MERVFFKSDKSDTLVFVLTTADGKIDFRALGRKFGLKPYSIDLCGDTFSTNDDLLTRDSWTDIKKVLPVAGTQENPVMVSGSPLSEAPTDGEPLSKKTKRSPDEFQSLIRAFREYQAGAVAVQSYFKKLLEAPLDLPRSVEALREFLSVRTEKLLQSTYSLVKQPDLVKLCTSEAEKPLATFVECAFEYMRMDPPLNETTSSARLFFVTGNFLQYLDSHAPADSGLLGLSARLESTDAFSTVSTVSTSNASEARLPAICARSTHSQMGE